MITVAGTLKSPLNLPLVGAEIRVISESNTGETVLTAEAVFTTADNGAYSFELVKGTHTIQVKVTDTYDEVGEVTVDNSTPNPITLPDLITYTAPVVPVVPSPSNPTWENVFNDVRTNVDSVKRENRQQLLDGTTVDLELNQTFTNPRTNAQLSQHVDRNTAGTSNTIESYTSYSDMSGRQAARSLTTVTNGADNSISDERGIYVHAGGTDADVKLDVSTEHIDVDKHLLVEDTGVDSEVSSKDIETINNTSILSSIIRKVGSFTDTVTRSLTALLGSTESKQEVGANSTSNRTNVSAAESKAISEVIVGTNTASTTLTSTASETTFDVNANRVNIGGDVFQLDRDNRQVNLNARLVVTNPDDFKGDPGDTTIQVFQYAPTNTGPWETDQASEDRWRRFNTSINGVIDPNTWSTPERINAQDGENGDTLFIEFEYSVQSPISWHSTFEDGDYWRRERTVTNSVPGDWSTMARIRGVDGAPGEIVTIEYQYSINGLTLWHTNFTTGDIYRRERTATRTKVDDPSPTYGAWSTSTQLVPKKGVDYFDALNTATLYLYQRATATPAAPTATLTYTFNTQTLTGDLGGWSESIPAGTQNIYIATAATVSSTLSDTIASTDWSVGTLAINGTSGIDAKIVRSVYQVSASQPAQPAGTVIPPTGWTTSLPTNIPAGMRAWIVNTYADDASTAVGTGQWTNVGAWAGVDGVDGMLVRSVYRSAPANSPPALPTGTTIPPTGWSESPLTPPNGQVSFVSNTYATNATTSVGTGDWSPVGQFSGESGSSGLTIRGLYRISTTRPTQPVGTVIPPPGWTENPPQSIPDGSFAWAAYTYATNDVTNVGNGRWTEVGQWSGSKGNNGLVVRQVYRVATSLPDEPTGTTIPPTGWSENPPSSVPQGSFVWATATYSVDDSTPTGNGNWTAVGRWSGNNGSDGFSSAVVILVRASTSTLTDSDRPTNTISYNLRTGRVTNTPNNSWSQDFPTNFEGRIWITTAAAASSSATDNIAASEWSTPRLLVESGTDGKSGAGFYSLVGHGGRWPGDSAARIEFIAHTGRAPIVDDHLTYLDHATNTRITVTRRYNGTTWVAPASIINGDLLVDGQVTAEKLSVTSISAVSATIGTLRTNSSNLANRVELSDSGQIPFWIGRGSKTMNNAQLGYNSNTRELVFRGTLDVRSSETGGRMEIDNDSINVFDDNGVLRVELGKLS